MTEEEKSIAFDSLPEDLKKAMFSLGLLSDNWSRDISDILAAAIYDRDVTKVHRLKKELQDRWQNAVKVAKDEGRLSAIPIEVLKEIQGDLKELDQYRWRVDRMLQNAIDLADKNSDNPIK